MLVGRMVRHAVKRSTKNNLTYCIFDKTELRPVISESTPVTTYSVPGVDVSHFSLPTNLILQNITAATTGAFTCEVSAGAPRSGGR